MQPQVESATTRNLTQAPTRARRQGGRGWSYTLTSWLGLVPFLLFCLLFEILPAIINPTRYHYYPGQLYQ